tara:strand:- start:2050 stop:2835 length:786 start_codon:yes stop_codon:yes gene_type:complete
MIRIFILSAALTVFAHSTLASDVEWWEEYLAGAMALHGGASESDWRINVGSGLVMAPDYPGSTEYEVLPVPLIDVEWREKYFVSTQRGLGAVLFRDGQMRGGLRLTYDRGRQSSQNSRLGNLRDIESSIEGGAFFELYRKNWRFLGDVRKGITDGHQGIIASGSAAMGGRFSEQTYLIVGAKGHYADKTYLSSYFSSGSFVPQSGGVRDIGGFMNFIFMITPNAYMTLDSRLSLLLSDAANSPLSVDDIQYSLGSIIGYRF